MKKQIPWKFLPLVLLVLFLPAIPAIVMRHNTREAAQAATVNETEVRQLIVDGMVEGGFSQADGRCVSDVLVEYHGAKGVVRLLEENNQRDLYHPVSDKLKAECQITTTH